jgi:poly-gamma-glutamate capsule biosynthesis protein CapA/YwtB (metallophosphatase superfamily)
MLSVSVRAGRAALAAVWVVCALGAFAARALETSPADRVVITVAGDVLPESNWLGANDVQHLFDGVREEFDSSDLVFVNLEEPITRSNKVTPYKNKAAVKSGLDYILRARNPALAGIFKDAGIGLVGLANNHMMDYTVTGLRDTMRGFAEAGLPVVGAGLKPRAERAYIFKKHGVRVALLAFSDVVPRHTQATATKPGVASAKRLADLVDAIWRARRQSDFVVLMMHWGGQGHHAITRRQRQLAQVAVKAGCDVIVGMHPHVLQGIEYMGGVPVFYSIGNFAFPSSNPAARECVMVKLEFRREGLESAKIVPVEISQEGAPRLASGAIGRQILAHLDGFCRMFNTRIEGDQIAHSEVREELVYDTQKMRPKSARAFRRRPRR